MLIWNHCTREQKTVVRLGYNEHVISPNEIWNAVGIIDTDDYRQLLESLRELGILYRSVKKNIAYQKAKTKKISKKDIPQFSIRHPSYKPDQIGKEETIEDATDDSEYAKIYVSNLPFDAKVYELAEIFNYFGEVVNVTIPKNPATKLGRGFSFIEFEDHDDVNKAINESGKIFYKGKNLYVQKFLPKNH